MIKLTPLLTEKSIEQAKEGVYTFRVDPRVTKYQVKDSVQKVFGVEVARVRTLTKRGRTKKNLQGKMRKILPSKKALVSLKGKDKIDLFETKS